MPKTEKLHGILDSHRTGNRQEESVILISCGKNSCFSGRSRKAALRAGCREIIILAALAVFFHGKPCRRPPKNKLEEAQEIRMPTRVGHV